MPFAEMDTLTVWSRALRDPSLHDLPYKIETNEYGQLVMSPVNTTRGFLQAEISSLLRDHVDTPGRTVVEFPIQTAKGVKVPDTVWISEERWTDAKDTDASPVAAEICIEVLSRSNTAAEIEEKRRLYYEAGAIEVWTCDLKGHIRFYEPGGERSRPGFISSFPNRVEV